MSKSFDQAIINKDQCFACKIFSVPLFYIFSLFFSLKNYRIYRSGQAKWFEVAGLALVPSLMFVGGTVNMYLAMGIFNTYQQDKEIITILEAEGINLSHLPLDEKKQVLTDIRSLVDEHPNKVRPYLAQLKSKQDTL